MAESKYAKYIVKRPKEKYIEEWTDVRKVSVYVDEEAVEGGYYLQGTWWYKASDEAHPDESHTHDFDEYLGFVGTNPDDPFDLGGEVELWLGDEKHRLTESCVVFVPAGIAHCPVYFRRVDSPIWFFATGPQKSYEKEDNKRFGYKEK